MALTLAEVEHIASLARLALSASELNRFQQQLSTILDYAAQLQALDTSQVLPTATILSNQACFRVDEAHPGMKRDVLLKNAAQVEADQFCVPAVLE